MAFAQPFDRRLRQKNDEPDDGVAASAAVSTVVAGTTVGFANAVAMQAKGKGARIGPTKADSKEYGGRVVAHPTDARAWALCTLPLMLSIVSADSENEKQMETEMENRDAPAWTAEPLPANRRRRMKDLNVRTLPSQLPSRATPIGAAVPSRVAAAAPAELTESTMWADPQPVLDELTRRGVWAVADYDDDNGTVVVRVKRTTPEADARAEANLPKVPGVTFRLVTAAESAARDQAVMAKFALDASDASDAHDETDAGFGDSGVRAVAHETPRVALAAH